MLEIASYSEIDGSGYIKGFLNKSEFHSTLNHKYLMSDPFAAVIAVYVSVRGPQKNKIREKK